MTTTEKAEAIASLLAERDKDRNVLRLMDSRLRWLGQAVPLLSFSPALHHNAQVAADILSRPGFSSSAYGQAEGRMLVLMRQAVTELEHGLTPTDTEVEMLKEDHTLWAYWSRADWSQRFGMVAVFGVVFTVGFLCGKVGFFGRLYDLIREVIP